MTELQQHQDLLTGSIFKVWGSLHCVHYIVLLDGPGSEH